MALDPRGQSRQGYRDDPLAPPALQLHAVPAEPRQQAPAAAPALAHRFLGWGGGPARSTGDRGIRREWHAHPLCQVAQLRQVARSRGFGQALSNPNYNGMSTLILEPARRAAAGEGGPGDVPEHQHPAGCRKHQRG